MVLVSFVEEEALLEACETACEADEVPLLLPVIDISSVSMFKSSSMSFRVFAVSSVVALEELPDPVAELLEASEVEEEPVTDEAAEVEEVVDASRLCRSCSS
jgi:hypothetical protein